MGKICQDIDMGVLKLVMLNKKHRLTHSNF